ncbi:MAG: hypothetical protein ABSB76_09355, partial [Streptosporangiaceae bacterium]
AGGAGGVGSVGAAWGRRGLGGAGWPACQSDHVHFAAAWEVAVIGADSAIATAYIAEYAPKSRRGSLAMLRPPTWGPARSTSSAGGSCPSAAMPG